MPKRWMVSGSDERPFVLNTYSRSMTGVLLRFLLVVSIAGGLYLGGSYVWDEHGNALQTQFQELKGSLQSGPAAPAEVEPPASSPDPKESDRDARTGEQHFSGVQDRLKDLM